MRPEEFRKLDRINASIPRHLIKNLLKTEKAFPGQKEKMKKALEDPRTPEYIKKIIRKGLEDGVYDKTVTKVDEKVAKQIEEHVDGNIQHQIRKGNIKPKLDPWARKRLK